MATALFGHIGPFDSGSEIWTLYAERLDEFFASNDIVNDTKKKSMLLTVIGADAYAILRSLVSPAKPTTKTYDELVAALSQHFSPTPSEIVERYKFNSRIRKDGESIATYVSELRKMSEFCNYQTTLDTMLRDRLVCGCRDDALQARLLAETQLTLAKAISIAQTMESAARNVVDIKLQNNDNPEGVHAVSVLSKQRRNGRTKFSQQRKHHEKMRHQLNKECSRCTETQHTATSCPFLNAICYNCNKEGHLARACRLPKRNPPSATANQITVQDHYSSDEHISYVTTIPLSQDLNGIYHLATRKNNEHIPAPYKITCCINGKPTEMEVDTGSAFTLMPSSEADHIKKTDIQPFNIRLASISGQQIVVEGLSMTPVRFNGQEELLPLVIYRGHGLILCGRTWISSGLPIWKEGFLPQVNNTISHISSRQSALDRILAKHDNLFGPELGCLKNVKVHLYRKPEVSAKFYKARSVPYALKEKVEQEIQRLEQLGIISPIPFSESAAPIVPVMKKNKTVRICGDFKVTSNQVIDREQYPLPRTEDIFAKLAGCTVFSRIDLRDAYCQLELDEESKDLVVINTTKGLYKYNRLPFGISSSAAIFQKHMEILLNDHQGVSPFQDDVVLGGKSTEDHLQRLDKLLTTLEDAGLKLRKDKCLFLQSSIDFLGHRLDGKGLHPQNAKMDAIMKAPEPNNVEELRSFLGLINYYSKFIPNHATHLSPLYSLLVKTASWSWGPDQQEAFLKAKTLLANSKVLAHFDQKKEVRLACDASPIGIGAVISHHANGIEQPIAFASRTLSSAEQNYSQMEREALAIVYGVTKFRDYLLGRRFKLMTDHQPLVTFLSEKKPVPQMAAARLQRWALQLSAYDYVIEYKKGSHNGNADALSRLPLQMQDSDSPLPAEYVFLIQALNDGPVKVKQLEEATRNDALLSSIKSNMDGFQGIKSPKRSYHTFEDEMNSQP